jgi:hypothetical protein
MNLLHAAAKANVHDISLRTKKAYAVHNHLSSLSTIKNSSQSHRSRYSSVSNLPESGINVEVDEIKSIIQSASGYIEITNVRADIGRLSLTERNK